MNEFIIPCSNILVMHKTEIICQQNVSEYTINDLIIDPKNEIFDLNDKTDRNIKKK